MPFARNAPKLCPAEPVKLMRIVSGGRPASPQRREISADSIVHDGAVDVADRQRDLDRRAAARAPAARSSISWLSSARSRPWSCVVTQCDRDARAATSGRCRIWREVDAARLPVLDRRRARRAGRRGRPSRRRVRKPSSRHDLAHLLGDEDHEVDHVLGLALELLAQLRVLRRDADRAGVEVADAHHDAARRDQRRGGEAELLGAEQRGDRRRRGRS